MLSTVLLRKLNKRQVVENKIPSIISLVKMRNFVNKNQDVENKIPNASSFIKNSEPELDTIDLIKNMHLCCKDKKRSW